MRYLTHEDLEFINSLGDNIFEIVNKELLLELNIQHGELDNDIQGTHEYRSIEIESGIELDSGEEDNTLFRVERFWATYKNNNEIKTAGTAYDIFRFNIDEKEWEEVEVGIDAE